MTPATSAPLRRTLAVLILLVVLALGWELAIRPLAGLSLDRKAEIVLLSEQLEHLQAVASRKPGFEQQARVLQAQSAASGYWTGPSTAAVAAAVQNLLRQVIASNGGSLKSTSEAGTAVEHGLRKVTLRFSIDGTINTVEKTLGAIETASPALFVDTLSITAPGLGLAPDRPPVLNLELAVAGYMPAAQP